MAARWRSELPLRRDYLILGLFSFALHFLVFVFSPSIFRTYDKLKETDHAAAAYCDYLRDSEKQGSSEGDEHHGQAYLYLANYYLSKGPQFLDMARDYAQKCVEYPSVTTTTKYFFRKEKNNLQLTLEITNGRNKDVD